MGENIMWWGYLHTNGTIQVKRWFGIEDVREAAESEFVQRVCGPWTVEGREAAMNKMREDLGWTKDMS